MLIKILSELGRRMDEHSENLNTELESKEESNRTKEYNKYTEKKYTRVVVQKAR